jgi:hypothetical protein
MNAALLTRRTAPILLAAAAAVAIGLATAPDAAAKPSNPGPPNPAPPPKSTPARGSPRPARSGSRASSATTSSTRSSGPTPRPNRSSSAWTGSTSGWPRPTGDRRPLHHLTSGRAYAPRGRRSAHLKDLGLPRHERAGSGGHSRASHISCAAGSYLALPAIRISHFPNPSCSKS